MIDELYDSVLSITNQTGYIDRVSEKEIKNLYYVGPPTTYLNTTLTKFTTQTTLLRFFHMTNFL